MYGVTFVSGTLALLVPAGRIVTNLVAAISYVALTILFYLLFRPVSRGVSLLAMIVSLTWCVVSVLIPMRVISWPSNPLPIFGVYCLLIGYPRVPLHVPAEVPGRADDARRARLAHVCAAFGGRGLVAVQLRAGNPRGSDTDRVARALRRTGERVSRGDVAARGVTAAGIPKTLRKGRP